MIFHHHEAIPMTLPSPPPRLDAVAERYVHAVLALGRHDAEYVDAYYGPPDWKTEVDEAALPVPAVREEGEALLDELRGIATAVADTSMRFRHAYLTRQTESLIARCRMLEGWTPTFDEESQALYDAVAPSHGPEYFEALLQDIDHAMPGPGTVHERYHAFISRFIIPKGRLDAVFTAAIEEGRLRTAEHIPLPTGETFSIEYVTGKSWSGYNWYKGNSVSLIQMNVDFPITIDRAIDLACHEGYPGHHVYNSLLEKELVREHGWWEYSVYALFSPQSLIAEGTANFGIEMAFPGKERLAFERDVLYPIAGLDPDDAVRYAAIQSLVSRLAYAGNEAARGYVNGTFTREVAAHWLERFAMMSPDRAWQRTKFFDAYRSYVINYNLGQDLVRGYVEARMGGEDDTERRWAVFADLLSSPRLPSELQES
jgi:hypothetical protein